MKQPAIALDYLLVEIRALIEDARRQVARAANRALTLTYWRMGKRLLAENLTDGRAEYGQRILVSLAQELEREFGKGFSDSALTRIARFADQFPDERILRQTTLEAEFPRYCRSCANWLSRQALLHFLELDCMMSNNKTRQGYARKCILKPAGYFFVVSRL